MSGGEVRIETRTVAQMVEQYVDTQFQQASKFENVNLLDESSVLELHEVAARIYAEGYRDGGAVERERITRERYRNRDYTTNIKEAE